MCDFLLVISSSLGSISHRLATIHPWQTTTDRRRSCHRRLQHGCRARQEL